MLPLFHSVTRLNQKLRQSPRSECSGGIEQWVIDQLTSTVKLTVLPEPSSAAALITAVPFFLASST